MAAATICPACRTYRPLELEECPNCTVRPPRRPQHGHKPGRRWRRRHDKRGARH